MDIMQREGGYSLPPGTPDTLGVEFSGTVAELGEGTGEKVRVGDAAIGLALGVRARASSFLRNLCATRGVLKLSGGVCRGRTRSTSACQRRT